VSHAHPGRYSHSIVVHQSSAVPGANDRTPCKPQALSVDLQGQWAYLPRDARWYGQDCPFIRENYKCSALAAVPRFELNCTLNLPPPDAPPFQPQQTVLWMGSSYERQPFQSLLCQNQRHIKRVEVMAFLVDYANVSRAHAIVMCSRSDPLFTYHGTLSEPPNMITGWKIWPRHNYPEVVASDTLVRVHFNNNARLLGAFNSHAALGGMLGVMNKLGVASARELNAVVAGPAHSLSFYQGVYGRCPWWPPTAAKDAKHAFPALKELQSHTMTVTALEKLGFHGVYVAHGNHHMPFKVPDGVTVLQAPSAAQNSTALGCSCAPPFCRKNTRASVHARPAGPRVAHNHTPASTIHAGKRIFGSVEARLPQAANDSMPLDTNLLSKVTPDVVLVGLYRILMTPLR